MKISIAGFKDPIRRPRYIMWTVAATFVLAAVMVLALGATSTRWFCIEGCHRVQDDTVHAYQKSSHSEISCMACHEPVNANTAVFLFKKLNALGELVSTISNNYRFPLNDGSLLSLNKEEMNSKQCTQCHTSKRRITPFSGIIINHEVHAQANIWCTVCHNRIAHNEDAAPPELKDPTGKKNIKHPNFMKMNACFRCHDIENKIKMTGPDARVAPGACITCHPSDFNLLPASHKALNWLDKAHGAAALAESKKISEEKAKVKELEKNTTPAYLLEPVNECYTCHSEKDFCTKCHGTVMPHPTGFDHKTESRKNIVVCQKCHLSRSATKPVPIISIQFCQDCHHKGNTPGVSWIKQHPDLVHKNGSSGCLVCHSPVSCAQCHTRSNVKQ